MQQTFADLISTVVTETARSAKLAQVSSFQPSLVPRQRRARVVSLASRVRTREWRWKSAFTARACGCLGAGHWHLC